jgi:arylsulfatase A-like enzyme
MGMARGFVHFEDHQAASVSGALEVTWGGRLLMGASRLMARALGDPTGLTPLKRAPDVLGPLLEWIDKGRGRPFFATVNLMDAHSPYLAPREFAARFGVPPRRGLAERIRSRLAGGPAPSAEERQRTWLNRQRIYDACIAYLDHELGRLLDELDRRGRLANTIVIVTSDHGEEFGEHGTVSHGHSLYWPALHVPLIIWYPGGVPSGTRVEQPVSLRAVPATIASLAGIAGDLPFPGLPLSRFWTDSAPAPDTVLAELSPPPGPRGPGPVGKGPMKSLVSGRLHYIRNGDGSEELYDVDADPFERTNLVATIDPATLEAFREVLANLQERRTP